ncbi:uncharacterized protein VP01_232g3 [Puccinia sorghi]|uniref:AMP-dependent synthetase/ligase domain-containing protein n=1 Tax=Puccinia sorghi TaxID=27349 RepID=A0A0L6V7G2_9BASI|nr:uncharacterized protein VP01_232g3 [Puccinia sorghi]
MENHLHDLVAFDQLAWILSFLILLSYLIPSILDQEQCWLVHPIILAHQATFSATRKQAETPTITSSGATPHSLPVTPDRSVKSLYDLLLKADGKLRQVDVNSIVSQDISFKTLVSNTRNHLWSLLVETKTDEHQDHPLLLILCADPYLKVVLSLAAATLPLVTILGTPKPSGTLPVDVKRALEPYLKNISLVVSDLPSDATKESLGSELAVNCQILSANNLATCFQSDKTEAVTPNDPSQLSKARLRIVSHSSRLNGQQINQAQIFEFTPQNLLAGITGSLGLFPLSGKLSPKDTIAMEIGGDESIGGFEISMAIAGLYAGANVYFFNRLKLLSDCEPTVLLLKATTAQTLAEEVIRLSKLSFLKKLAIGRRLSKVYNGRLGSPLSETTELVGHKLRAILTDDPISQSTASLIRAGFGVSLQRVYVHPVGAGPLLASQQYDFQLVQPHRPTKHTMIQCGPPGVNVECKIVDVPEPSLINYDAWKGKLVVRGPSVGTALTSDPTSSPLGNFYPVADVAQVLPNGTFQVFSPSPTGDD